MAHGGIDNVLKYWTSSTLQSMENLHMVYPALRYLIAKSDKTKILINTILTLNSLIEHNNEYVLKLINDGAVPHLIKHLEDLTSSKVIFSLERAVYKILFIIAPKADEQLQLYIISFFTKVINHLDRYMQSGAMNCLAKMAADLDSSRQIIMEAQLLPGIIKNLTNKDLEIREQTKALFTNLIFNANRNQIKKFFGVKVIDASVNLIKSQDKDIVAVSIFICIIFSI